MDCSRSLKYYMFTCHHLHPSHHASIFTKGSFGSGQTKLSILARILRFLKQLLCPPRNGPRNGPFRANRMTPKSSNTMQNQQTTSHIPLDHESSRLTSPLAMRNCPCCVFDRSWPPLPKFLADTSNPCYTGHYKYPHHYHNTPQN